MNNRFGEIRQNNKGTKMKIVAYRKSDDIDIEFLDEHHYVYEHATYVNFSKGQIKNPFDKTIFNIGYHGLSSGMWRTKEKKPKPEYNAWKDMIERCCTENSNGKFSKHYDDVSCCEEWLCFASFEKWYKSNVYDIGSERLHLDKDIKYKGNKIYSPYHCILVPQSINEQFKDESTRKRKKDNDLPCGIKRSENGKYKVSHRGKYLGTYSSVDECLQMYMESKKVYITELVNKYNTMPVNTKNIILDAIKNM